jgi:hypothetical protein
MSSVTQGNAFNPSRCFVALLVANKTIAPVRGAGKTFFDKIKVQLFVTLEFHAAVRGE